MAPTIASLAVDVLLPYCCVMSEPDIDDDFDATLWLAGTKITEAGLKKLKCNDIIDKESIISLSGEDVLALRLSIGDKVKFVSAIAKLTTAVQKGAGAGNPVEKASGSGVDTQAPTGDSDAQLEGGSGPIVSEEKSSFDLSEVAAFLAGKPIPANVLSSIASLSSQGPVQAVSHPQSTALQQQFQQPPPQLSTGFAGNSPYSQWAGLQSPPNWSGNQQVYGRPSPFVPYPFHQGSPYLQSTVPLYSPRQPIGFREGKRQHSRWVVTNI